MFKKILASTLLCLSVQANALSLDYDEPQNTVAAYKVPDFKYAGENDVVKIFINPKLVYNYNSPIVFEKIRLAPIRLDLKVTESETDRAGMTYVNYMYFNCITKQNMLLFIHTYDEKGDLVREEVNTEMLWRDTEENSNTRLLNEYICGL